MTRLTKVLAVVLVLAALLLGVIAYRLAVAPKPVAPAPIAAQVRTPAAETFPVVVAHREIKAGSVIVQDDVRVVQWPVGVGQGFQDIATLEGKSLRRTLAAGEPVTQDLVMTGLAQLLEPGQRAVSVSVNDVVGNAAQIAPGDFVDVFFTLDKTEETPGAQARLLHPRIKVLTFGRASIDGPPPERDATDNGRSGQSVARTATLAVPLESVNEILLGDKEGRLQYVLRPAKDETVEDRNLFPERLPVLAARSGLTPEQRAELQSPANRAYAGDSLMQLSNAANAPNRTTPVAAAAAPRSGGGGGGGNSIQIWRGGKPEVLRY